MKANQKERFHDIDLLRFLAALSVVFFHYTFRGYAADGMSILSFQEVSSVTKYGYLGVNIFFMISGFVILMSTYSGSIRKFVISRFTRLYPTFWVAVLLTSLVSYIIGTEKFQVNFSQILLNLTMIPKVFGVESVDGVYWTLLIELKFYILVTLIMLFRFMKHIKIIALLWVLWSLFYYFTSFPYRLHDFLFPQYSSYFIAGAMFFLIRHEGISYQKTIIVLLAYISSVLYALQKLERQIEHFHTDFSSGIVIGLLTLFYLIMYLIATKKTSIFNTKVFYIFGALTYPLYLIHQNIGYMLFNYFGNEINRYFLLFIVILLMLFLSYLIHKMIENKLSTKLKVWLLNGFMRSRKNFVLKSAYFKEEK